MSDYVPTTEEVEDSYQWGVNACGCCATRDQADVEAFQRWLAEVRRQAAEEALLKAEDAVSELIDGYESTADEMRGRSEWVDSNRYSNYAASLSMAAGSIRTLAAEYRKAEG